MSKRFLRALLTTAMLIVSAAVVLSIVFAVIIAADHMGGPKAVGISMVVLFMTIMTSLFYYLDEEY